MKKLSRPKHLWFKFILGFGLLLGLLLIAQTILSYRFVVSGLLRQEARKEADARLVSVNRAARLTRANNTEPLLPVLHELVHEAPKTIDWIRIIDRTGRTLAESEPVEGAPRLSLQRLADARRRDEPLVFEHGDVMIVLSPFRVPGSRREESQGFLETAVFLNGVSVRYGILRQNLIVGITAAFALLGAIILIAIRFPHYMRSRHVEDELALARRVQLDLFPVSNPANSSVDFAARCIPALEVGGDLYDVFETETGEIALVLGDVSGKGLPAALLMGVVQGAVRASTHPQSAERLNHLLCLKTARERFVSLFWCTFDPQARTLRYVNAGHLPPLLVREGEHGPEFRCLDEGGPVLGLLPHARYAPSEVTIRDGDLLVVYSDGILEAANANDEDFGEDGVRRSIVHNWRKSPEEMCSAILADVAVYLGKERPQDDQTLLIARLAGAQTFVTQARA